VTVLDTSAVVDYLLGDGVAEEVQALLRDGGPAAAPDLVVFEVLAVLRRDVSRGELSDARAQAAITDLGDVSLDLFPTLALRQRAFDLRHNMTAADALFVALAEILEEPFATRDRPLAAATRTHTRVEVHLLVAGAGA
jgi:predicted nucleic acid-binding protein